MKLLHIHREILELASEAAEGPTMPPPAEIEGAVSALIGEGLLFVAGDRVTISEQGLAALAA